MTRTFADTPGYPHAQTTIVELEQIAREPENRFGGGGRGSYFSACLKAVQGSLTVYFPGYEDGPRRTLGYADLETDDRKRLTVALAEAVKGISIRDLAFRIWVRTGPPSQ